MALSISFISPIAATPQPKLRETLDRDQAEKKKPTARPKKTRENEVSLGKAEPLQVLEVEKKVAGNTQREQKEAFRPRSPKPQIGKWQRPPPAVQWPLPQAVGPFVLFGRGDSMEGWAVFGCFRGATVPGQEGPGVGGNVEGCTV